MEEWKGLTKQEMIELLHREVVPALGCTEPVCVALACADAAKTASFAEKEGGSVCVEMNPGIYKNGKTVGIPGFPKTGLKYAAALGALLANPEKELELLEDITPEIVSSAEALVESGRIQVSIAEKEEELYVKAQVSFENSCAVTVIRGSHSNIVYRELNGTVQKNVISERKNQASLEDRLCHMSLQEIYDLVQGCPAEKLEFMLEGAKMNEKVADFGVNTECGIGITKCIRQMTQNDVIGDTLLGMVMRKLAGSAEGRMSGCPYVVMSSAGSGNHGLETILPVTAAAGYLYVPEDRLCRGLALSHMLNVYIKQHTGRLSATCGCGVSAAASASAAMVYLMGGTAEQMGKAIINMAGNITGMICDGGKVGCALKLATAGVAAVMSAYLAMDQVVVPADNGICADTAEKTIVNMGRISKGMVQTDHEILKIMLEE